jgi:hypothetical protein
MAIALKPLLAKAISDVGWGMFVILKTLAGQKLTPPSFHNFLWGF